MSTTLQKDQRQKLYVDARTQRALALRMVLHCLCFMTVGGTVAAVGQYLTNPIGDRGELTTKILTNFSLYALTFVVLLPALLLDSFRLSNRIVGPVDRLRSTIKTLARGEAVPPLKFRQRDYWQDIPEDFNRLLARLDRDAFDSEEGHCKQVDTAEPENDEMPLALAEVSG
ncbi:MAG: hypothetical protein RH917_17960 [Lacipirellulaceae bacterium]